LVLSPIRNLLTKWLTRDRSTKVSEGTTKSILKNCKPLAQELLNEVGDFDVLILQCGLRPSREGGPRVESELVDGVFAVVHSYGHAGAGYASQSELNSDCCC